MISSRPKRSTRKVTIDTAFQDVVEQNKGETIRSLEKIIQLYNWNEIPDWQKDNEHIISGYVKETNSFFSCIESLFYLHNESVNVYSHLIPAVCFLMTSLLNKTIVPKFRTTTVLDYLYIDLFFLGAFTCLILSSTFHCFKSHSLRIATFGNKLDYLGIVVLISTSMISLLYYGFYDTPSLFYVFAFITLSFGLACATVSLKDKFRSRECRAYRATLFVCFGLSAVLPVICGLYHYGFYNTWHRIQLKWVLLEGVFYIFGAFLYGIRFPEKYTPGKYDIWGHSHQLFHILVVIAALCHFKALMCSYEHVHMFVIPSMLNILR
ncbi:hypothetical protein KAFR_0G02650 [Kazachstania africana CBS 2517]|uniref:Uncharacterized protein n=1 Tax=Kazachstania africana (strain ATCC 22294 / BCRC 22015 / CBS 2517 / CECT 1963 / NBRC 1671 / NRRL Y-8276) TaxID=1071382 RepID=H2AY46_KAZAF|nr:hypothetical protein KAFR_0G02650 [Kazachstania africana CBS 2517]CCF59296.1 hypothetical protein KAFR_0G02650 [Kazachstania africana CBS 2517]